MMGNVLQPSVPLKNKFDSYCELPIPPKVFDLLSLRINAKIPRTHPIVPEASAYGTPHIISFLAGETVFTNSFSQSEPPGRTHGRSLAKGNWLKSRFFSLFPQRAGASSAAAVLPSLQRTGGSAASHSPSRTRHMAGATPGPAPGLLHSLPTPGTPSAYKAARPRPGGRRAGGPRAGTSELPSPSRMEGGPPLLRRPSAARHLAANPSSYAGGRKRSRRPGRA